MSEVEVYVAALCPFAHRVRLALAEKGIVSRQIEIDPRNKPAGFADFSPLGQVPLLVHQGRRIWGSAAIVDYLDEVFTEHPLLPRDPALRAHARAWVDFADTRIYGRTSDMLHNLKPDIVAHTLKTLAEELRLLEARALGTRPGNGPYWIGDFSHADIAFYPWFEQLCVLETFLDFRVPPECGRLNSWRQTMAARDSTRAAGQSADYYLDRYGAFLRPANAVAASKSA